MTKFGETRFQINPPVFLHGQVLRETPTLSPHARLSPPPHPLQPLHQYPNQARHPPQLTNKYLNLCSPTPPHPSLFLSPSPKGSTTQRYSILKWQEGIYLNSSEVTGHRQNQQRSQQTPEFPQHMLNGVKVLCGAELT
ncbi:hypothetical protein DPEC_G00292590 [Dallia pectoralis]|uniref:Uncharacterized protein n=1 Tax=Dallia pectoralis TaxID=75939 RepID=A0ACC2FI95_DALPE|nr:hypothetical protein DPEC_G00292590 [Dallia pectoralis]